MPIYEYDCRKCGKRFEALLRRREDNPPACPACGTPRPVKAFSAFAVGAADPTPHCQTCPTAASTCASGRCSANACPFGE